jgi:menaquinone-dependent protoporphyrinogen oxidase
MSILVAYASRHGATQGIAERIAETLRAGSLKAEARPARDVSDLTGYDAFVIGSAVYMFHWLKDATRFLRHNRSFLADRPVWLFSSGPLGTETTDAQGRDVLEVSQAKEIPEFIEAIHPRDHTMFFGAFFPGKPIGLGERFVAMMPAARKAMPQGDFRDWEAVEAWAEGIARALGGSSEGAGAKTP